jgi:hypothetical protein
VQLYRHIFLVDGLGAVASTVATAYVLPALQPWIGLPHVALFLLAVPAAVFATYSLSCWLLGARPVPWLAVILIGNLAYCLFVLLVLAWYVSAVTPLGWAYFAAEALVVAAVIAAERRVLADAGAHHLGHERA